MPSSVVKSYAEKSGKSVAEVEAMWDEHIKQAEDKGLTGDSKYAYVVAILKKRLKIQESVVDKLLEMYLVSEEDENVQKCAHCHSKAPVKGKTVCGKCAAELKSFRNKNSKKEDDGNEG